MKNNNQILRLTPRNVLIVLAGLTAVFVALYALTPIALPAPTLLIIFGVALFVAIMFWAFYSSSQIRKDGPKHYADRNAPSRATSSAPGTPATRSELQTSPQS